MTETPEQRVARLQCELAEAKVEQLQAELAQAQAGVPGGAAPAAPVATAAPAAPSTPSPTAASALPVDLPAAVLSSLPPSLRKQFDRTSALTLDTRLAPAPRRVPLGYRLMVLPWSWWTVFTLFMISTAPLAAWIIFRPSGAIAGVVGAVGVLAFWARRDALRLGLLKWGEVANVVSAEPASVGTYYSGVTYQNVRLAQAHGWDVTRQWYSGPGTTTKIAYELDGTRGELTLHGLPYTDGVILAHSKHPGRAACVSSFPYDLTRDADGNWTGALPRRAVVGAVLMLVVLVAWTVGMVLVWR